MSKYSWRFNRTEFAGALGDLGTLLPIAIGMIIINGVNPTALWLTVGVYYILSALYFRIPVPVQPMKVIGAYAIAASLSESQISTAGLLVGFMLLILAVTGVISLVGKVVPKSTVRGVQLTTGVLLTTEGVRCILGQSTIQKTHQLSEPFLSISALGTIPIGILLGVISIVLVFVLIGNRRVPAALIVVGFGTLTGLIFGGYRGLADLDVSFYLPEILPYGWPAMADFAVVLFTLALPQLPMTVGNAIIAQADLTKEYFGQEAAKKSSFRALAVSMGLANLVVFLVGGMPLCHGAGGLAAHYRFGARTAGSNLMIGGIFILFALLLGSQVTRVFTLIPFSVLGALLIVAGSQLALMILDLKERKDMFVAVLILGVSLASSLAVGFLVGFVAAFALKQFEIKI
jgi:SulP family sulfate permease